MQITKYPQSCLKIEREGRAIIFDIGSFATAKYSIADFGKLDAVIYTHRHPDHLDLSVIDELHENGVSIYGNADVAEAIDKDFVEIVEEDEELVVAGFKIQSRHMEHCLLVDGTRTVQNTGFVIEDKLLVPGDCVDPGKLKVEVGALPIFGPDISFHDAYKMALELESKIVIPIHYDIAHMDPHTFTLLGGDFHGNFELIILEDGQSVTI